MGEGDSVSGQHMSINADISRSGGGVTFDGRLIRVTKRSLNLSLRQRHISKEGSVGHGVGSGNTTGVLL